jgi:hypothetical protein
MHTFVLRVFVATDLTGFVGFIEEPATGFRRRFRDPPDLIVCLLDALSASMPSADPERDLVDHGGEDPTSKGDPNA